jgi:hypothetical protein
VVRNGWYHRLLQHIRNELADPDGFVPQANRSLRKFVDVEEDFSNDDAEGAVLEAKVRLINPSLRTSWLT